MKTEGLTWLTKLPDHELNPTDALYLRESGVPVIYRAPFGVTGMLFADSTDGMRVYTVTRDELAIRLGHKRALPPAAPARAVAAAPAAPAPVPPRAVAAPAPAAPAPVRAAVAAPAPAPTRVPAAAPVAKPAAVQPGADLEAWEAQKIAAINSAKVLSLAIIKLQDESAAAGRPMTSGQALAILNTRGQIPGAQR